MIKRIGYNPPNPLVLLDLSEPEREAFARVLTIAEAHLDEIPFPELRSRRRVAEMLVCELREALELPLARAQPRPFEDVLNGLSGQ
jgi:hypothetical protein